MTALMHFEILHQWWNVIFLWCRHHLYQSKVGLQDCPSSLGNIWQRLLVVTWIIELNQIIELIYPEKKQAKKQQ